MSNLCSSCGKFAALETPDPEVSDSDVEIQDDGEGNFTVSLEVPVVRMSECCGEEMKRMDFTFEEAGSHACAKEADAESTQERYSVVGFDCTASDRQQTHDRHGKKITRMRYARRYIGAEISIDVTCALCGETITVSGTVEDMASAFEEA